MKFKVNDHVKVYNTYTGEAEGFIIEVDEGLGLYLVMSSLGSYWYTERELTLVNTNTTDSYVRPWDNETVDAVTGIPKGEKDKIVDFTKGKMRDWL